MPIAVIESRVQTAMSRAFIALGGYLRAQLEDMQVRDGALISSRFNLTRLDSILRSLRVQMDALGYREAVQTQLAGLQSLHQEILAKAGKMRLEESFSRESEEAIRILLIGAESELTSIGNGEADAVGQILRRSIMGQAQYKDLLRQIRQRLQTGLNQALTLATTSLHSFYSSILVKHSLESGVKWFGYIGPDDSVTRDWCEHWVGRRGTVEMFEATAKKWGRARHPPGIMTWRGGWNCRHSFAPLSEGELAKYPEGPA